MKVAIPLFNNRVSPRFEYAPALLLATIEAGKIIEKKELSLTNYDLFQRVALLKEFGVDTLICGGINNFFNRLLDWRKVQVISPISGDVEEVLSRFLQRNLYPPFTTSCPKRGHWRCRGGNRRRLGRGNPWTSKLR